MAEIDDLKQALVNADKAGDTAAATKLADALDKMSKGPGNKIPTTTPEADAERTLGDMSFADKFFAGAGKTMVGAGQAVEQITGTGDKDLQKRVDNEKAANKALGKTAGGFAGEAAALAPTAFIPGVNTWVGAAALGGATGALQPTATGESRALNTIAGGAGGAAGKVAGDVIGAGIQKGVGKLVDAANARNAIAKTANAVRDSNLQWFRDKGYKAVPSMGEPTVAGAVAEGVAGPKKLSQSLAFLNQKVTNQIARNDLHLPGKGPITQQELASVKEAAIAPYEAIKAMPIQLDPSKGGYLKGASQLGAELERTIKAFPRSTSGGPELASLKADLTSLDPTHPETVINKIYDLRADATQSFSAGNHKIGNYQRKAADLLEDLIEDNLKSKTVLLRGELGTGKSMVSPGKLPKIEEIPIGDTGILQDFRNGRQMLAKLHDVAGAYNKGTGNVISKKLADAWDKGAPLSGGLEDIAKAHRVAADSGVMKESGKSPAAFDTADWVLGAFGAGAGHPAIGAAASVARPLVRKGLGTDIAQKAVTSAPSYAPGVIGQGAQLAARTAGNQKAKFALTDMMATFLADQGPQKK